jgi:hypothetical protein
MKYIHHIHLPSPFAFYVLCGDIDYHNVDDIRVIFKRLFMFIVFAYLMDLIIKMHNFQPSSKYFHNGFCPDLLAQYLDKKEINV